MPRSLASRLKDRVTLQRYSETKNEGGGLDRSWADVPGMVAIAAEVVPQSGREGMIASTLQGVQSYRVTIRQVAGERRPSEKDRLLYRPFGASADEELNIRSVNENPFLPRAALDIYADTEAPQGMPS